MPHKILNSQKKGKVMKPIKMPTDMNCAVGVPLQFQVQKDLNIAKRVKPNKVFENYKVNVKKVAK